MKIDNEVKNKVVKHYMMNNFYESYRILFKLYNKELKGVGDKIFVLYNMALISKKMDRLEESKKYIDEAMIYVRDKDGFNTEKCHIMWLYIELNKSEISKDKLIEYYQSIKNNYYYYDDESEVILGIDLSIGLLKEDFAEVENILNKCFSKGYIQTYKNTLKELEQTNKDMYDYFLIKYDIRELLA